MRHLNYISLAIVFSLLLASTVMHGAANAQDAGFSVQEKPLLIVRYNQRTVYYNKALYMAVSKAVEAKPDVTFRVLSLVPQTHNEQRDNAFLQASQAHTRRFMQDMQGMGVPQSRIQMSTQRSSAIDYDEIHLHVQ